LGGFRWIGRGVFECERVVGVEGGGDVVLVVGEGLWKVSGKVVLRSREALVVTSRLETVYWNDSSQAVQIPLDFNSN
jgi:hypothetical protein